MSFLNFLLYSLLILQVKSFLHKTLNRPKSTKVKMLDPSSNEVMIDLNIHPSTIVNNLMPLQRKFGNQWSYSEFIEKINNNEISGVSVLENGSGAIALDNNIKDLIVEPSNLHTVKLIPSVSNDLVNLLNEKHINFDVFVKPSQNGILNVIDFLLNNSLNILFAAFLISVISNAIFGSKTPMNGNLNDPMSFLTGSKKNLGDLVDTTNLNTTFADVAGCDEAKYELVEVVDFLKNSTRFTEAGAKIPKGVLLAGSPGTGKTMLARAVANEANVGFLSASGSEFIEMFVGVGASRVRKLFDSARENAPCVVFIDEIDAIGRQRGAGIAGGNDEREQTLNQILTNMDGFEENDGIVVIAATNRIDILDNALTRPGRFDRKIQVPLPDFEGRKQIANVHFRNKKIDESIDFDELSSLTGGFSGADIANLANEAAIFSVRQNKTSLDRESLLQAYEKITIGLTSNNQDTDEKVIDLVSYHEAGHALMASIFKDFFDVRKVTINANKGGAGGYTLFTPKENYQKYATKKFILSNLIIAMGGRAAEVYHFRKNKTKNVLDSNIFRGFDDLDVTTGATNDLMQANKIARDYFTRYGFGEEFGCYDDSMNSELPFMGREMGSTSRKISESTKYDLDNEVKKLVNFAYTTALELIYIYEHSMEDIVDELKEKREISGLNIQKILITNKENQESKEYKINNNDDTEEDSNPFYYERD